MKLLMISGDRSVLSGKKGAFWYTLEALHRHFERIDVICPKAEGSGNDHPFETVWFHPSPHGLLGQTSWILEKGKELIAAHGHGVMTVHEYPPFYNGIGARRLHAATGVPFVLEVHHIVGHPVASSLSERIGSLLSRRYLPWAVLRSAGIRTVNHEVRSILLRWGVPLPKISVVPSFYLDPHVLRPDPTVRKTYDLAFCARLVENKGLESLLHVVATLPNVSLLVIGEGPMRSNAEQIVLRHEMGDRVRFVGWLPTQEEAMHAIQSAKIFVMNSRSEGGPRVALEAMACGMPVIATPVGVMPDVLESGRNGILVTGHDRHLKEAIEKLLGDEALRTNMGVEAQKILQRFDRETLIQGYADFLTRAASAHSS